METCDWKQIITKLFFPIVIGTIYKRQHLRTITHNINSKLKSFVILDISVSVVCRSQETDKK